MLRRLSSPAAWTNPITALCLIGGLVAASPFVTPRAAHAQERYADMPVGQAYQTCLAAARSDPEAGFEAASAHAVISGTVGRADDDGDVGYG